MFKVIGNPNTSLSQWNDFRGYFPSLYFEELVERKKLKLSSTVLPLARGGAVASTTLLRRAGCRPGSRLARGWERSLWSDDHELTLSETPFRSVVVRKTGKFWLIARNKDTFHIEYLVFLFGSTLVLTRDCRSAKRLAQYFFQNVFPGLRWVNPDRYSFMEALEFPRQLRQRQIEDAKYLALQRLPPKPVTRLQIPAA